MSLSAPEKVRFCANCGASMETRVVGDKPRRTCTQCNFIHFTDPKVGVGVFVVKGGKILLVRRAMAPEIGKWSIPAGYIDHGEEPQAVAVREALEETNLNVEIEKLIDVYHNPPEEGGASVFILYRAKLLGGTPQAGDDADAVGFFGAEELPEIAFKSTRDVIGRFFKKEVKFEL